MEAEEIRGGPEEEQSTPAPFTKILLFEIFKILFLIISCLGYVIVSVKLSINEKFNLSSPETLGLSLGGGGILARGL